ncbi:3-oxo-5-alpha-steroid 4-dehydrogenase-domain-containing protein [Flammula alnicola]|nr:3-oxo-5-alpha-steroid 4-dehydrogenase-domain-containing protein [Flammula alnicola]
MRDPTKMFTSGPALFLYNESRKWFTLGSLFVTPILLVINAPFGRFTPQNQSSIFLVDGIKSWIFMELISPSAFIYTFLSSPLTMKTPPLPALIEPPSILALCFLLHYLNRALVSPLRTPSRSKTHLIVPLSGVVFNIINGSLMGSYLSSPFARMYHQGPVRPSFYVGLGMWAMGLVGNIYHDEVLLNIRRKAKSKGKGKADGGEHYSIPQGGLYSLISYPNYFFEWFEWLGFAIAASPLPFHLAGITPSSVVSSLLDPQTYINILNTPAQQFMPNLSPPWIFFISEVLLMLPRAYKGHKWYHSKFGDAYPKNRKAVIPFVL